MKQLIISLFSLLLLTNCKGQVKSPDKKQTAAKVAVEIVSDSLFDFEKEKIATLPAHWSEYFTGKGESTKWRITTIDGDKVLTQLSDNQPNYHFNEVVYDDITLKNVQLSVKMKALSGRKDQGGGFVWRFIDKNNYYVVRANPLEDNVVLYKVKNGIRTDLPLIGKGKTYGVDVKPMGKVWNELQLIVKDTIFTVYLNGEQLFQVEDTTFTKAGKVGLWTKADAVTSFDDFKINGIK